MVEFFSLVYIIYMVVKTKDSWHHDEKSKDKEKSYWDYFTNTSDDEEVEYVDIDAVEILRQRYARGEINNEEYRSRMEILNRD